MTRNEIAEAIGMLCTGIAGEGDDRELIDKLEDKFRGGSLSYYMTGKLKKLKQRYLYLWGDE